jgi:hypothetical protein
VSHTAWGFLVGQENEGGKQRLSWKLSQGGEGLVSEGARHLPCGPHSYSCLCPCRAEMKTTLVPFF